MPAYKKKKRIMLGIYPQGKVGVSISLFKWQLTILCMLSAISFVGIGYFISRFYLHLNFYEGMARMELISAEKTDPEKLLDEISSLKESDSYTEQLRELHKKGASTEEIIKFIGGEFARVKDYEKQLKQRAFKLESLLRRGKLVHFSLEQAASKPKTSAIGGGSPISYIEDVMYRLEHLPMGLPTCGHLSSGYGPRRSPFTGRRQMHKGLDIAAPAGTPLVATGAGRIKKAEYQTLLGRYVLIDHGDGIESIYGHMKEIHVESGRVVSRGERIGLLGSTGRSTGAHVHYELRVDGKAINPWPFVDLAASVVRFLKGSG